MSVPVTLPCTSRGNTNDCCSTPNNNCSSVPLSVVGAMLQVFAPLDHLLDDVAQAQLQSPTLIVIGEVVRLAPGWQFHGMVQHGRGAQSEPQMLWPPLAAEGSSIH